MSQGAEKKATKKREAKKMGRSFVCAATKQPLKRAIIVKFADGSYLPFVSLCVAARYIDENTTDEPVRAALLEQLAADTEQSVSNMPRTKSFALLRLNGGTESFEEWHAELSDWIALSAKHGYTPAEWDAASGVKRAKGTKKDNKLVFDAATYLIPFRGKTPVKLTCGVASKVAAKGDKPEHEVLSDDFVSAARKVNKFVGDGKVFAHAAIFTDVYHATVVQMSGVDSLLVSDADRAKTVNAAASKLIGRPVHGPAIVTFVRKTSVMLEAKSK
jgi:hypothetical protein